jgi:hypothetical protein
LSAPPLAENPRRTKPMVSLAFDMKSNCRGSCQLPVGRQRLPLQGRGQTMADCGARIRDLASAAQTEESLNYR